MGGRGAGGRGGGGAGGGVVKTSEPFETSAEKVFLKYDLDRRGGELIAGKKIEKNDLRWIQANKERLIRFKQKIDWENEEVKKRYRGLKDTIVVEAKTEGRKTKYEIREPVLEKEGLRLKIKGVQVEKYKIGEKEYNPKELWNELAKQLGGQKFLVNKNDIWKFLR